ncbi:MAG: glycine oxidase ThiO [Actinomycetota bacterium]|nr:glycine oxidase ThiO [Actinomycetota bacterium]
MRTTSDVIVVGAGVIGTTIAWRCAQRGLDVTLIDPAPRRGAWHTAAGMLAPVTELHYTEAPLLRLNAESLSRYPAFVDELTELTGLPTGFRACGTVSAAWDSADLVALRDMHAFLIDLGMRAQMLTGRELRALEPALASGLPGGLLAPGDHQVDPRLLHAALLAAGRQAGVRVITDLAGLDVEGAGDATGGGERVVGVILTEGTRLSASTTVLAAGAWSATVAGLNLRSAPQVRPVKGQTLRLRLPAASTMRQVVRGSIKGSAVYVVPRGDGQLVVGASSEEAGYDVAPRAGAVYELLRDAQSLLPELSEATLEEVCTGLRPGTPDNAPLLGPGRPDGLVLATGHYRNGILLAPVTADAITELVSTGKLPDGLEHFAAMRFAQAALA